MPTMSNMWVKKMLGMFVFEVHVYCFFIELNDSIPIICGFGEFPIAKVTSAEEKMDVVLWLSLPTILWNTISSESSKPTRLSTYQLVSFNLCYLSPLIGEWKYFHRVSSTIMSSSTHNNILGVTLSGDFGDVCTLSDLRPNRSWAIPHNCLIIVSAHNIDRAEAAAAIPSLAMSWPSLQFGSIRGQHLQAVSYMLS